MPEETAHGTSTNGRNGHVSFSELVRAHFDWDSSDADAKSAVRGRFRELLDEFQEEAGEIVDAYWCRKEASAVALTRRERVRHGALRRRRKLEYRLHRVSDWVTGDTHEIADLLHDCDILAIKAANGLEGVPRAVVMQWLLLVESHLLGFMDRHRDTQPDPVEVAKFAASERAELRRIETYYVRAGEKRARMTYMEGMLGVGVLYLLVNALVTAGFLALFGVLDLEAARIREFYASAAAGGVGAIVSVLMRMSGRGTFTIDHELGRWQILLVGAYRPLVGSVSGIVVYFLVQTPLVPIEEDALTLPFYVTIAFVAGFSERWTRMMLSGAMRTIGNGAAEPEDAHAPAPPPEIVEAEVARTKESPERAPEGAHHLGIKPCTRGADSPGVRLRRNESGFTLVELLTVLVLLAVLMTIAVASFLSFRQRAQDRAAQAVLREAMPSVHAYSSDHAGGFTGMTEAYLRANYDAGLSGFVVASADDSTYCLRTTLNPRTWYGSGPPLEVSQTAC